MSSEPAPSQPNGTGAIAADIIAAAAAAAAAPHTLTASYPAAEGAEQQQQQQPTTTSSTTTSSSNDSSSIPSSLPTNNEEPATATRTTTPPPLTSTIASLHEQVQTFLSESHPADSLLAAVQKQTRVTLDVFAAALDTYPLRNLSLSYNGGKDCLVMLVLFLASLHPSRRRPQTSTSTSTSTIDPATRPSQENQESEEDKPLTSIPAIYALPPDPFPEVEEFVAWSARHYHLDIVKYTTDPPRTTIRSVFADYLAQHPDVRAVFVGTRRTDPHGTALGHQNFTDSGWPKFLRYHPVIDWHYTEIWAFIRHLGLHYCSLYDQGYTSLGGTADTRPNPKLRVESNSAQGDEEQPRYRPAYELTEDLEERLGRN
ncbi:FAD synthase [Aspergillus homomorphus CBS 101889]|uniref:FAD synthase n=1 Tax=Aspergillus homomorphus (strain CBS 101889) TaxID=1450537 RepID=A0A395ID09_ASPHC|nr:adenine nucleotide alpha hydrolases-like protein [Aspergillus homomorphus CBS 101889]RAL17018.1 adenine nucleotide alpha hydrolases-like protein [Aspergillus homomorphus CBS 101889]